MDRIKVIYITGWGRSGTTILDRILGQIDGFTSVGEIRYVWDRNIIDNHLCGCGQPFQSCPEWTSVFDGAFGGFHNVDPYEMIQLRDSLTRTRHLAGLALPGRVRDKMWMNARSYLETLSKLYRSIKDHFGAEVIVDSSKFPTYAFTLEILEEIDLHVVHLVRDPRAVSFSWLRKKLQPDTGRDELMDIHGPVFSTLIWNAWNLSTEMMMARKQDRYTFLRYEDFVAHPRRAVQRILADAGMTGRTLPFVDDHTVRLDTNHTCAGNPNRFQNGDIKLRLDDEWTSKMKPKDRAVVTAMAAPILHRYGYPHLVF